MITEQTPNPDEQSDTGSAEDAGDSQVAPNPRDQALSQAVERYRQLVASMPGLIPEMVSGETVDEIDASAEASRQAYAATSRRIAESLEAYVPIGNPSRSSSDMAAAALKPEDKIALGIRGK